MATTDTLPAGFDPWKSGGIIPSIGQIQATQNGILFDYLPQGMTPEQFVNALKAQGVNSASDFKRSGVSGSQPLYTPYQVKLPGQVASDAFSQVIPPNTAYYIDPWNVVHYGRNNSDGTFTFATPPSSERSGTAQLFYGFGPNASSQVKQNDNGTFTVSAANLPNLASEFVNLGVNNTAYAEKSQSFLSLALPIIIGIAAAIVTGGTSLATTIGTSMGFDGVSAVIAGNAVLSAGETALQGGSTKDIFKSGVVGGLTGGAGYEIEKGLNAIPGITDTLGKTGTAALGKGLTTTAGSLFSGQPLGTSLDRGLISGGLQEVLPGTDVGSNVLRNVLRTELTQAYAPSKFTTELLTQPTSQLASQPSSFKPTMGPGSAALGQALRTDVGAPIFGGTSDEKQKQNVWNQSSLRNIAETGE